MALDASFSGGSLHADGESVLGACTMKKAFAALDQMQNKDAANGVRQRILQGIALDPFARDEWLVELAGLKCTTLSIAGWAEPALAWAADQVLAAGIEIRNIDVLIKLAKGWTMTVPELANAVKKV